jgi:hypothetical protein
LLKKQGSINTKGIKMKQMESDKHTIAWFKLAECVSRGEREKALGVYRLLVHSLDDKAYAAQLEGDLLWAFKDSRAVAKYTYAAQLYHDQVRLKQAIAVYEHVHHLARTNRTVLEQLILLYGQLGDEQAQQRIQEEYISLVLSAHEIETACDCVDTWCQEAGASYQIPLYKALVLGLCRVCPARKQLILPYLEKLLEAYLYVDDQKTLQLFLSELKELNAAYYKEAETILSC